MTEEQLPDGAVLATPAFARDYRRVVVALPPPLGSGSCGLILPASWKTFPVPVMDTAPRAGDAAQIIAQLEGPEVDRFSPFAQVQYARLLREISAFNWLRFYCEQMQYVPHQVDALSDHTADALVGLQIAGRTVAARISAQLFGPHVYIAAAGVAANQYEQNREVLGLAVRSFALTDQTPGGHVEEWNTAAGPLGPRLSVPRSWIINVISGPDDKRGAFEFTSQSSSGGWVGQMRVRWLDQSVGSQDATEARKMVAEFAAAGVTVGRMIASSTDHAKAGAFTMVAEAVRESSVAGNPGSFEFWQIALHNTSYRVLIAMLTPSRTQSFFWWSVNRRALEIVASTLQ